MDAEYGGFPMTTVNRVDRLISFTARASWARGFEVRENELFLPRFESVGEVDAGTFLSVEAVTGLSKLEANFHVGDSVGSHHEFIAMQTWQQVLWNVCVPLAFSPGRIPSLSLPFLAEMLVNNVNNFDEKGSRASRGIEDLDEGFIG